MPATETQTSTGPETEIKHENAGADPKVIPVKGTVKDEKNAPLPGVNIVVKGTQQGTSTDSEGQYQIEIPDTQTGNVTLVFSFVGYESQEVAVGGRTVVDVNLNVSERGLDEVVVVGYGEQRKSEVTGAISTVSAREIAKRPLSQIGTGITGNHCRCDGGESERPAGAGPEGEDKRCKFHHRK